MPTLAQSINVDGSKLPRATAPIQMGLHATVPAPPSSFASGGVSTLMKSSLPVLAAGVDIYTRQFYAGGRLPQRRFLPAVGL